MNHLVSPSLPARSRASPAESSDRHRFGSPTNFYDPAPSWLSTEQRRISLPTHCLAGSAALLAEGRHSDPDHDSARAQRPRESSPLPGNGSSSTRSKRAGEAIVATRKRRCGSASYLSLLSLLQEKVGYPWTTMPDMLMVHAAAGFGGHGTLCARARRRIRDHQHGHLRREARRVPAEQCDRRPPVLVVCGAGLSDQRFDNLSPLPKQIKVKAMSPLCHTSVSKWSLAAGVKDLHDQAKIERCAKCLAKSSTS